MTSVRDVLIENSASFETNINSTSSQLTSPILLDSTDTDNNSVRFYLNKQKNIFLIFYHSIKQSDSDSTKIMDDFSALFNSNDEIFTQDDLNLGWLSVFFSGKMTQHAFNQVLRFLNFTNANKYPSNFNSLVKSIMKNCDDEIKFSKTLWCENCCKKVLNIENRFVRNCSICDAR